MTQDKNIKIVFWGTPEFALPTLETLFKNGYNIVAVITNPDKPVGRKNIITPPPVKVWAEKHNIPVFQPPKLEIRNLELEIAEADLYIVAAYGKIIPKEIINLPKCGSLNIHPSLLPRWRGPSPIQYTILNGDTETGVTIIKMDEKMDHGPILAKRELKFSIFNFQFSKITYQTLHDELTKLGAELLIETLPKWIAGEIKPTPQNEVEATYSKILKKEDGRIDWSQPAEKIEKKIRAFNPWPGAWTTWSKNGRTYRLRIEEADIFKSEDKKAPPGLVWKTDNSLLCIKTAKLNLSVKKITLEGKKTMEVKEFLRGYPQIIGQTLI